MSWRRCTACRKSATPRSRSAAASSCSARASTPRSKTTRSISFTRARNDELRDILAIGREPEPPRRDAAREVLSVSRQQRRRDPAARGGGRRRTAAGRRSAARLAAAVRASSRSAISCAARASAGAASTRSSRCRSSRATTGEVIAALVLGFRTGGSSGATDPARRFVAASGCVDGCICRARRQRSRQRLARTVAHVASPTAAAGEQLRGRDRRLCRICSSTSSSTPVRFIPPAYEVALYPLAAALARQRQIRSHVLLAGAGLLVVGLVASHLHRARASPRRSRNSPSHRSRTARTGSRPRASSKRPAKNCNARRAFPRMLRINSRRRSPSCAPGLRSCSLRDDFDAGGLRRSFPRCCTRPIASPAWWTICCCSRGWTQAGCKSSSAPVDLSRAARRMDR